MENVEKFYSNRVLTLFLGVMLLGMGYLLYSKVLADPYGITDIARIVLAVTLGLLIFLGVVYLFLTFDPRPIIQFSKEGIMIRSFVFIHIFIPWEDVVDVRHEVHQNQVTNMAGRVKVSTNIFRIYRPGKRAVAVNLTLLNKRGNRFYDVLRNHLEVA